MGQFPPLPPNHYNYNFSINLSNHVADLVEFLTQDPSEEHCPRPQKVNNYNKVQSVKIVKMSTFTV